MNTHRVLVSICAVLLAGSAAEAQPAPPAPPAPVIAPVAPLLPLPPADVDFDFDFDYEDLHDVQATVKAEMEGRRAEMEALKAEMAADIGDSLGKKFALAGPKLLAAQMGKMRAQSDDRLYERGQRSLDGRNWDEALDAFSQVAARGGSRADGAHYWKAYTLYKLGRRDEALAAVGELRKAHASSRWMDDAKVLEVEIKQAAGQPVKPESEVDEEIKLMALNGIMESDPERALPLLESLLKSSQSPKLKERALFVLAQSESQRGRQVIEQVARGSAGNPDLQLKAINYLGARSKRAENGTLLWEIYQGSASTEVKERILHSLVASGNAERLLEVARSDKDPKLRRTAIYALGSVRTAQTGDSVSALYGSESDPEVKKAILNSLSSQRNAKALVELARKETNPELKREIVGRLTGMRSKEASDYLLELIK